jgi:hypothetical protein
MGRIIQFISAAPESLQYFRFAIPTIVIFLIAVILFQIFLRRMVGKNTLRECHEVGGYYLSLVGGLYGVLIGLIVVDSLTKFESASVTVDSESRSLIAIHTLASLFPEQKLSIQTNVKEYLDEVIDAEWALMERDKSSPLAAEKIFSIAKSILKVEPQTENQKATYPVMLSEMVSMWESRRHRIRKSEFGIPYVEWAVLIIGGIITIIFTCFFFIESHTIHLLMTAMISLLISMSLYLILLFGEPFSGDVKVQNSFLQARKIINGQFD